MNVPFLNEFYSAIDSGYYLAANGHAQNFFQINGIIVLEIEENIGKIR